MEEGTMATRKNGEKEILSQQMNVGGPPNLWLFEVQNQLLG
jgi:hypothetical protein